MAFTIKNLDNANEKAWDDIVRSSSHGTIFHTVAWLRLAQVQSETELHPLMFYKGTQLVAIYPVFIQKKGVIRIALSPPSRSYMLYLGPVLADYDSLKQDKKESIYIQIQQEMDKYLFETTGCKYARIRSSPGLYDSRPLKWAGYTVDPYYTYRIDLTGGIKRVWEQFDRKLRVEINKAVRDGVTVRTGNQEDLEFIHDSLFARYREQGLRPSDNKKYLRAIYSTFYPDNLMIFIAEYKGQRIGGTINLCFKNIMYLWVGIPKSDLAGISPNALVQWEAIRWAQNNGLEYYEEMEAGDDPRLIYFKAKFNPELVIWYSATKYSSFVYKAGETLFKFIRKRGY
jgi:lipid II:glycine glycyltransferase (peptidoglycan interpeptide bridge formation enzyme)